jgi:hypothetical protein
MSNLSNEEFAHHKERANRIAKSIKVKGEWVNPDKGVIQDKQKATRDWHASIAPMKKTIGASGRNFAKVMGHVQTNSEKLTGRRMSKDVARRWARDTHDSDPKNFIKNIGL